MRKTSKKRDKNIVLNSTSRFILQPLATVLYGYGSASVALAIIIVVVCIIRRDFSILEKTNLETIIIIIVGVLTFFPSRKFRKNMFDKL